GSCPRNYKCLSSCKIITLKKRVKKLEKKRRRMHPNKGGRLLTKDLDADVEVNLVNDTQELNDDNLMFDTDVLEGQEIEFENVIEELVVSVATITKSIPVSVAEVVTTVSTSVKIPYELTLAQTLIKSWDNTQAMMEADFELAQRLQAEEQGEITIKERSRLFVELMNRRKKHFARLRAEEIRRKPPTKAQKRNQMSTYLKNMAGFKHSQLKSKSYDEIQKLFDKEMKRVNTFVDMNSEVVKGSETRTEESSKRAGDELESDKLKKQKIDEHVEAEKDDDPKEEDMKKHMEIVQNKEEIANYAIPLAIKPPMIVEYKIVKEGQKGFYHLIRADGSSKRYSSMIRMLQGIDREDLETLWKLVKEKHGINRLVDEYERVLWGDLKVMFEPDIKSDVWRNLYPLTPITILNMLNKKLQADRWDEMCYQLLKLMTKQEKVNAACAQLQLLSDYYCWKEYADRDEIKD
ncbi:hypothetical protein Tco_0929826, partial [Tanacetum coccineum]